MTKKATSRLRSWLFIGVYFLGVTVITVGILEVAARYLGVGNPIIYYNAAWGGVRPLPEQQVTRLQGAAVTIDGNGFRSAVPYQSGALRVLYLGDSVTWGGSGVDDAALFTEVSADVLRTAGLGVYAMNAGVNGTALVNHAEIFVHHSEPLDALVWLFPWGDVRRSFTTVGYLMPARFKPRFALVEVVDHLVYRYWINAFRDKTAEASFTRPESALGYEDFIEQDLQVRMQRNLEALREAVQTAQERNIPVIIGVTPNREGNELVPLTAEARQILQSLATEGVTVFDVSRAIREAGIDVATLYHDNVHFNTEGHRVVGEALGAVLQAVLAQQTVEGEAP